MKEHKKTTGILALILVLASIVIEVICQVNMDDRIFIGTSNPESPLKVEDKVIVTNPEYPTPFSGTIKKVNNNDTYDILFDQSTDGVTNNVQGSWISRQDKKQISPQLILNPTKTKYPSQELDSRLRSIQKVCLLAAITLMIHAICA